VKARERSAQRRIRIGVPRCLRRHDEDDGGEVVAPEHQRPLAHAHAGKILVRDDEIAVHAGERHVLTLLNLDAAHLHRIGREILVDGREGLGAQLGDREDRLPACVLEPLKRPARHHPGRRHQADAEAGQEDGIGGKGGRGEGEQCSNSSDDQCHATCHEEPCIG
jgi:hypothetical protein